jgi:hypothetical protein
VRQVTTIAGAISPAAISSISRVPAGSRRSTQRPSATVMQSAANGTPISQLAASAGS